MRFYGGKGVVGLRVSKAILDYMESQGRDPKKVIYLEPFCGALGVLRYLAPVCKRSYANDLCKDLIMLWKSVKNKTFKKPKITEERWKTLKFSKGHSAERAFAGFGCSFGGVWFNGYISGNDNNNQQYSSLIRQQPAIECTVFSSLDYIVFLQGRLNKKQEFLIYFDPPYKGTCGLPWESSAVDEKFDSGLFWEVARNLGKMPNVTVIVSEFSAPKDFKCIKSFKRLSGMHNTTRNKKDLIEKLYTI